jgi:plasmid stabilization system protein ParE
MAKVVWSELSLEDLQNIFEYISKDSQNYAGRQIEKIIEKVE